MLKIFLLYKAFSDKVAWPILAIYVLIFINRCIGLYFMSNRFFIIASILCSLYLIPFVIIKRKLHKIKYEKNQSRAKWYKERFLAKGTSWCDVFISEIYSILGKNSISFVSPTANIAKYEKAMFDYAIKYYHIEMICSDGAALEDFETDTSLNGSVFKYFPCQDAFEIGNYYPSQSDVIFDMKGALWYAAGDVRQKVDELLKCYFSSLALGGLLIFDDSDGGKYFPLVTEFLYHISKIRFIKWNFLRTESSTSSRLKSHTRILEKYFIFDRKIAVSALDGTEMIFHVYRKNISFDCPVGRSDDPVVRR